MAHNARALKVIQRNLEAVRVQRARDGRTTRPMTLCTGDRPVTWNSIDALRTQPQSASWLLDTQQAGNVWTNDTRTMPTASVRPLPTARRLSADMPDIQYRACTCWLQCEWCTCLV